MHTFENLHKLDEWFNTFFLHFFDSEQATESLKTRIQFMTIFAKGKLWKPILRDFTKAIGTKK